MIRTDIRQFLAAFITLSLTSVACAQYVWIDEKDIKQYSDRPPPASVPDSRILKAPGKSRHSPYSPTSTKDDGNLAPPELSTSAKLPPPMTTAEKNADFQKRLAEKAEKEKKAAEEEKLAAEKNKNCERARQYQQSLESGNRITKTEKNGENSFLTDEQRARELRDMKPILEDCK